MTHQASPASDWRVVGAQVVHTTFGTGTVAEVGLYKGQPTIWIDFDRGGRRALHAEYAAPHVRMRSEGDQPTPEDPAESVAMSVERVLWL